MHSYAHTETVASPLLEGIRQELIGKYNKNELSHLELQCGICLSREMLAKFCARHFEGGGGQIPHAAMSSCKMCEEVNVLKLRDILTKAYKGNPMMAQQECNSLRDDCSLSDKPLPISDPIPRKGSGE